jgi:hypothetical protein
MKESFSFVDARNDKFMLSAYFAADQPYMMSASERFRYIILKNTERYEENPLISVFARILHILRRHLK